MKRKTVKLNCAKFRINESKLRNMLSQNIPKKVVKCFVPKMSQINFPKNRAGLSQKSKYSNIRPSAVGAIAKARSDDLIWGDVVVSKEITDTEEAIFGGKIIVISIFRP
ncbi:hypothetical protein [Crucivirus-539]|nr:hypothetical protein [Crucivirus-539]